MARREGGMDGGSVALGFCLGIMAGAALGAGLGLLLAPKEGPALRRDLTSRARHFKDKALGELHRFENLASQVSERGKDMGQRIRAAATEGVREARRQSARPWDPAGVELAGVEGTGEPL